jgi:2-(1,2-epoxy-1,2-dihydrophenyl)acetyl-CoA isomerase
MSETTVLIQDEGPVRLLTLNRPQRLNALNEQMKDELVAALKDAAQDPQVAAVVITGAGRAFSAGADLARFTAMYESKSWQAIQDFTDLSFPRAFAQFPKPLIAAINGPAVGWGATMPLMCDLRLMSRTARMAFAFVRVGVTPEFGSSYLLPRLVGLGRALELVLTAREIEAEEALDLGLVNRLCAPEELLPQALELGRRLAQLPAPAVRMAKQALYHGASSSLEQTLGYEISLFQQAMQTPEHYQAVKAMQQALAAKG